MKNKTTYLFGEKAYYEKSLKNLNGTESIYELFDNYYLQLDLIKYKLFGEDVENFGDLIIHRKHYSPFKINIDFLGKNLKDLKLFRKIFINDKNQKKDENKWRNPTKGDIRIFLKILKEKKLSPINFFKFKKIPYFLKKNFFVTNNNVVNKNSFSLNSRNKQINVSSSSEKLPYLSRIQSTSFGEKDKLSLSPIFKCRHKQRTKIKKENNIINENKCFNSFNCPYEKENIQDNNFIKNKKGLKLTKKINKKLCVKENKEKNKRKEEVLLIKNKLISLKERAIKFPNSFLDVISKSDEQKPQLKKRFKFLISHFN